MASTYLFMSIRRVSSNRTTSSSVTYGHSVRFHARWSRATVRAGLDRRIRRRYEPVQFVATGPSSSWSVTSRTKQDKISQRFLLSRSPCSHLRRRRLLILFFSASCYRFMPETTSGSMPGAGTGLWCMSRTQASSGPTKAYTWHIKQLRFKSDFFWNHVNAVILFIIVVVESLRGTFFSHWCLDAKQDAVKTKLHSKSR